MNTFYYTMTEYILLSFMHSYAFCISHLSTSNHCVKFISLPARHSANKDHLLSLYLKRLWTQHASTAHTVCNSGNLCNGYDVYISTMPYVFNKFRRVRQQLHRKCSIIHLSGNILATSLKSKIHSKFEISLDKWINE